MADLPLTIELMGADTASQAAIEAACSPATAAVLAERIAQIDVHKYTPTHDYEHAATDLVNAADAYLEATRYQLDDKVSATWAAEECDFLWPFTDGFKVGEPRDNLVKAAALILAAIDRLDATTQQS